MAIVRMTFNNDQNEYPNGAYCMVEGDKNRTWQGAVILYSTHHGLCLFEREMNGRDDSDFYMTVWNPELGKPEELFFATTRGWTYPCYASCVDATPETLAAYEAYKVEAIRRNKVRARWQARKSRRHNAVLCHLSTTQYDRLTACYNGETLDRVLKLLASKLRSQFRIKLATQIREWLADNAPKYNAPLSWKQLQYV